MRRLIMPALVAAIATIGLAACGAHKSQASVSKSSVQEPSGKILATVNGEPLTENEVDAYISLRTGGHHIQLNDAQKRAVVRQLADMMVVAQAARKEGLDKNPDVQSELAIQRNLLLAHEAVKHYLSQHPISKKQLKEAYKKKTAGQSNGKEYKARHILVKTKAKAEHIIKQLEHGANFATLAKKDSTGPSAKNGGELGWFKPNQMVPAFSTAVAKLKPGQFTHQPVKTQYGWHVIELEKERPATPPSFASMKSQLENQARSQLIQQYVQQLDGKANVNIKLPKPSTSPNAATAEHTSQAAQQSTSQGS